ncbi:MAG: hypothetical protein KIT73_08960 [Burkholderiales bacterium]|nr:hypothetical protein [Burkholderiales bacterium]
MTASQATVMFLGTGVVTPVPTTPIVIDVTNPTGGSCISQSGDGDVRCMRVTVSAAGQVRMCDPALAATAASGCRP